MAIYRFADTVLVPFPFTETARVKRRPAVTISSSNFNSANDQLVLAMITAARLSTWVGDSAIQDLTAAGLEHPSFVRWKLFTLPVDLIIKPLGRLAQEDAQALRETLSSFADADF